MKLTDIIIDMDRIQQFDNTVMQWMREQRTDFLTQNFLNITALGSTTIILMLLAVWACRQRFWGAFTGILCLAFAFTTVEALKVGVERHRPVADALITLPQSFSFPSSHAAMSMCMFLILAMSSRIRRSATVICALIGALLVGCSRVYLGVHYPSDVIAGLGIGLGWAIVYGIMRINKHVGHHGAGK